MLLYLSLFFLLTLITIPCFFSEYKNKQLRISIDGMIYVFAGLLICLGGLRWTTGSDWNGYHDFFANLSLSKKPLDGWWEFEPGFILFNFAIKSIYNSYTLFLIVFHLLLVTLSINGIKKLSKLYSFIFPIAFFLYFCATKGDIVSVRIALSRVILFNSIIFIVKKKPIAFLFYVFIAITNHMSSMIFIIAYPLYYLKLKNKMYFFIWCIFFIFTLNTKIIFDMILKPLITILPSGRFVNKFLGYAIESQTSIIFQIVYVVRYSVFIPIILYFIRNTNNKIINGIFNIYFFGCLFFILFSSFISQFQRGAQYFTIFEMILLAIVYNRIFRKENKILFIFIIFLYGFSKMYQFIFIDKYCDLYVPYISIFSNVFRNI